MLIAPVLAGWDARGAAETTATTTAPVATTTRVLITAPLVPALASVLLGAALQTILGLLRLRIAGFKDAEDSAQAQTCQGSQETAA